MVSSIVGDYLIKKGLITKEQFKDLLNEQQNLHFAHVDFSRTFGNMIFSLPLVSGLS